MRATRLRSLLAALALPLAGCVEVTGPDTVIVDNACRARSLWLPSTVSGALTAYSCMTDDATASFVDYYELELNETQWVDLYLESLDFDAYLLVYDNWDELVVEDDDSGEETDAWITVKLPAGRYYIAATSFDGGERGVYKLYVE